MNFRPLVGEDKQVRVVSWNTNFPGRKTAKRQGDLLRELDPDLMLLQEVNPGSSEVLRDAAGADWMVRAIDLRTPEPDDLPVHRGVAIAGRGLPLRRKWLLGEIEQSERILLIETQTEGTPFSSELSRSARREVWNRQAAAGSRLRALVVYPECAVVVRRRRQHAVY
jgi:hypothetical protein